MSVTVEPATLSDIPRILEIFYLSFNDEYMTKLFPPTPEGRAYVSKAYQSFIHKAAQDSRLFVVRDTEGNVVSSALYWVLSSSGGELKPWVERWGPAVEGLDHKMLDEFFKGMYSQHEAAVGDSEHIFLEVLCTHDQARRRGYATKLLELGNSIADERDYPCYLDAEKDAKHLYETLGYIENTEVPKTSPSAAMVRPKKSDRDNK